ncbi:MAG: hypothetical protein ACPGO5_00885 [Patescibacteria group bacterium]
MNRFLSKYSLFALGALALFGATTFFAAASEQAPVDPNGDRHQHMQERREHRIREASTILDVSVEDIRSAMEEGMRFPEIIESYGYDQETFRNALNDLHLEQFQAHLDEKVANGDLTQEEADEMYARAEAKDFFHFGKHGKGPHHGCNKDNTIAE